MYTNSARRQWSWHLSNYTCVPPLIVTLHSPRSIHVGGGNSLGCALRPTFWPDTFTYSYTPSEEPIYKFCDKNCTSATKYDSTIEQCVLCPLGKFATGVGALNCSEDEGIRLWRVFKYIVKCYWFTSTRILCISDCVCMRMDKTIEI